MFAYSAWLSASSGLQGIVGWTLYALTTVYAMTKAAKGGASVNGNDSSVRLSESLTNVAQPESSQRDPPDSETAKSLALLHLCGRFLHTLSLSVLIMRSGVPVATLRTGHGAHLA
ncbi:hypothetical protein FOZ63_004649 [Perkinsus olseni]|nr:hypothetical protein FOZ63_004649 [Perkinsus olseni]